MRGLRPRVCGSESTLVNKRFKCKTSLWLQWGQREETIKTLEKVYSGYILTDRREIICGIYWATYSYSWGSVQKYLGSISIHIHLHTCILCTVCDETQNQNETESETFSIAHFGPIPIPILFPIPQFFETSTIKINGKASKPNLKLFRSKFVDWIMSLL